MSAELWMQEILSKVAHLFRAVLLLLFTDTMQVTSLAASLSHWHINNAEKLSGQLQRTAMRMTKTLHVQLLCFEMLDLHT